MTTLKTHRRDNPRSARNRRHLFSLSKTRSKWPLAEHVLATLKGSQDQLSVLWHPHDNGNDIDVRLGSEIAHIMERTHAIGLPGSGGRLRAARTHRRELDSIGSSQRGNMRHGTPTRARSIRTHQPYPHAIGHSVPFSRAGTSVPAPQYPAGAAHM